MATQPYPMNPGPDAGPETEPPGAELAEEGGGTLLCLHIGEDGRVSAYKQPGAAPEGAQQVADFGQGLKALLEMYRQIASGPNEQAFDQGFGAQQRQQPPQGGRPQMGG